MTYKMIKIAIIRKLDSGKYRLFSKKKDKSGNRRNLGTFDSLDAAKNRERQVQYFKQQADDGAVDKETAAVSKMSDIAQFLEKSGFIDAADKVYMAMNAVDGSFADDEDYLIDMFPIPDNQSNIGGSSGFLPGNISGGAPSLFSVDQAERVASIANELDKIGFYDEADLIDDLLTESSDMTEIIKNLEKSHKKKKTKRTKKKKPKKQNEEIAARTNGRVGNGVIDNQNAGMFQGFSDAYFYSGYGDMS